MKRLLSLILAALLGAAFSFPAHSQAKSATVAPHRLGLAPTIGYVAPHRLSLLSAGMLPASADLRADAPAVRDQGSVGSCGSNATTNGLAWYEKHLYGYTSPGGFAPMEQYAAITSDPNRGTTFAENYDIQQATGAVPLGQYTPKLHDSNGPDAGMYDYQDTPNATDNANAVPYRITGYHALADTFPAGIGQAGIDAIKASIAAGTPVAIGFSVFEPFMGWNGQGAIPAGGSAFYGRHANEAFAYDAGGLWTENSWGTSWGRSGWAYLSWAFVAQEVQEAWVIDGVVPLTHPTPTATPRPTTTSTATPTATARPSSTSTPTATPSDPTPTPTVKPIHGFCRWWRSASGGKGYCRWWVSRRHA